MLTVADICTPHALQLWTPSADTHILAPKGINFGLSALRVENIFTVLLADLSDKEVKPLQTPDSTQNSDLTLQNTGVTHCCLDWLNGYEARHENTKNKPKSPATLFFFKPGKHLFSQWS